MFKIFNIWVLAYSLLYVLLFFIYRSNTTIIHSSFTQIFCSHFSLIFMHLNYFSCKFFTRSTNEFSSVASPPTSYKTHTHTHTHRQREINSINRYVVTWILYVDSFEGKLRYILSSSITSFSSKATFSTFYALTTRNICLPDYSDAIENFFVLSKIWKNV